MPLLSGCRILVVDDEMLIAGMIEDTLHDEGCDVVGPFGTLVDAVVAAATEQLDGAILDINLHGEMVYPAAEILDQRGVPFIFVTGYGTTAIPNDRPAWIAYDKPLLPDQMIDALTARITRHRLRNLI